MNKFKVLWYEPTNSLCVVDDSKGWTELRVFLEESDGPEPFVAYPVEWLVKYFNFIDIGKI